jgi:hypothetical protein
LLRDAALGMISDRLSATEVIFENARTVDDGVDLMLGSLDAFTGIDPGSLLFAETFLAATRDDTLRGELIGLVTEFQQQLARWLAEHGANAPENRPPPSNSSSVAIVITELFLLADVRAELPSRV